MEALSKRIQNPKHRKFIDEYFKFHFNATRAYMETYGCEYDSARANCQRLIAKDSIREEIERRLSETVVTANEALYLLDEFAKFDPDDIITVLPDGQWFVDYQKAKDLGKTHLIEKIKVRTIKDEDGNIESWVIEADPYNRLKAVIELNKIHGRYVQKIEHSWKQNLPEGYSESEVIQEFKQMIRDAQSIEAQSELIDEKENNHEL
jgi:phage terminase small subunit